MMARRKKPEYFVTASHTQTERFVLIVIFGINIQIILICTGSLKVAIFGINSLGTVIFSASSLRSSIIRSLSRPIYQSCVTDLMAVFKL